MEKHRVLEVPTGHIIIAQGDKGLVELMSIGDYGQEHNLKCDALGLNRDIEGPVKHVELLPLTKKWVITISTQMGCSMGCTFCDVPKVGPGRNVTKDDLVNQVLTGLSMHPEIKASDRLNIHFARMGEPTWNPDVLAAARWYNEHLNPHFNVHPVVSTMMPHKNRFLLNFIHDWMEIKNVVYGGNAGLQLSINSTSEEERNVMFNGNACHLETIATILEGVKVVGRKITLNFAVADYEIDPSVLLKYFDPELFICKLTPMHLTDEAIANNIKTQGDYTTYTPYAAHEEALKAAGYDVLVFIASVEEDLGRITCGNAILSGVLPEVDYKELDV